MSKKLMMAIVAVTAFCVTNVFAQSKVYDIITLKEGKGIIKGFINEQVLGKTVTITPSEAILQIDVNDIQGGKPTKTQVKKDSITVELDVITLNSDRTSIEGNIVAESPGKWYKINTTKLSPQTYSYDVVEKIGKGVIDAKDNLFEEYGLLDVLELENNKVIRGIIVEQIFGEYLTIKDVNDNKDKVVDFNDIKLIKKEPYKQAVDIFKQSAFLDVVHKVKGGTTRGIIIRQIPGESVIVEFPSSGGNSDPISYSDIEKISREINPFKEKSDSVVKVVVNEPDSVGVFFYKDNNINRQINAYTFQKTKKNGYVTLNDSPLKAIDIFKVNKELVLTVKVDGDVDDILPTIKVWDIVVNVDRQTKVIPTQNVDDYFSPTQSKVSVKAEKYGKSSIKVTITPRNTGEYAVTYKGCKKITVFGVE